MASEDGVGVFKLTYYIPPTLDLVLKECPECGQEITESVYLKATLSLEPHGGQSHVHVHLESYHVRCLVNKLGWHHVPSIAWSENSLYLLLVNKKNKSTTEEE